MSFSMFNTKKYSILRSTVCQRANIEAKYTETVLLTHIYTSFRKKGKKNRVLKSEMTTINEAYLHDSIDIERFLDPGNNRMFPSSEEYQNKLVENLQLLLRFRKEVYQLSLFSSNECLEDIQTKHLKFLMIEYYLGELLCRRIGYIESNDRKSHLNFANKLQSLARSNSMFLEFLGNLQNYEILNGSQIKKLQSVKKLYGNDRDEDEEDDYRKQKVVAIAMTAAERRDEKIMNFKLEKQINSTLDAFYKRYPNFFKSECDEDESSVDEDSLRELYINKLRLYSLKSFSQIEMNDMEIQVINNRPAPSQTEIERQKQQQQNGTPKEPVDTLSEENDYGYTDKLETIKSNKKDALLSKEGKVLQPFTIVSKRDEIKKKTFGYGGYKFPTMTVEEFINEEIKNGGIKTETTNDADGNGGQSEDSDDDDSKIYEKRQWDEFKDDHRRGEGNMKNKG